MFERFCPNSVLLFVQGLLGVRVENKKAVQGWAAFVLPECGFSEADFNPKRQTVAFADGSGRGHASQNKVCFGLAFSLSVSSGRFQQNPVWFIPSGSAFPHYNHRHPFL
jgi:hypothetical protein